MAFLGAHLRYISLQNLCGYSHYFISIRLWQLIWKVYVFLSLHEIVPYYILSTDIINRYDKEVFYCVIMKSSITYDSNYYSLAFDENKLCATALLI